MLKWLICIPLLVQWLALAMRHRNLTLPTVANPGITAGRLVGGFELEQELALLNHRPKQLIDHYPMSN